MTRHPVCQNDSGSVEIQFTLTCISNVFGHQREYNTECHNNCCRPEHTLVFFMFVALYYYIIVSAPVYSITLM